MPALKHLAWSTDVGQATWLAERLGQREANEVTSIVPGGFEAYARVLHPVTEPSSARRRLVRWRDVAAWSGRPLEPDAPFHAVAIPPAPVSTTPPWSGQGPRQGSLATSDAMSLFAILRRHTRTPDDCWFCLWDGYGWSGTPRADGTPSVVDSTARADPTRTATAGVPTVELGGRRYSLYRGPVNFALVEPDHRSATQTANVWWPEDRAWCVASDVDLAWTYVGGSVALVRSLVGDPGLEAIEVAPDSPVASVAPRVTELVQPAVDALLRDGSATVVTPVGTVDAQLQRPRRLGRGSFRFSTRSAIGAGSTDASVLAIRRRDDPALRQTVERHLVDAVVGLVGG